jgi:CMP-N-acetylneuraminic acid synthetase
VIDKIAALVPMKHHSQRVPEKNYRELAGKPLYHHILKTLTEVPEIDLICVDTDSMVIKEGISKEFPGIKVLDRPLDLRADDVSMNRIIEHDMSLIKADLYLQTHSTNPLLRPATISRAIKTYLENKDQHDSLFSVTRLQIRLYDKDGWAINHNPSELLQTQDLPSIFEENSCLYLFSEQGMRRSGHRIGRTAYMFEIDPEEAWDIDSLLDFEIVDCLMTKRDE